MANETKEQIINKAKEIVSDYSLVRERLILRLANKDRPVVNSYPSNHSANSPVIMPGFCDLCTIASVIITDNSSLIVNQELLDEWKIGVCDLYLDTLNNSKKNFPPVVKSIGDVVSELGGPDVSDSDLEIEMLVVTNEQRQFGASAILYYEDLPDEFYMLPSSIHETIILPMNRDTEMESNLKEIVKFVNDTDVDERERLSYNVYYNRITHANYSDELKRVKLGKFEVV